MLKQLTTIPVFMVSTFTLSQVGVQTETPQRTLHVNGSLQITNELNVGGDGLNAGNAGTTGQVLISKGANHAPEWQTLAIPTLPTLATGTVISIDGQLMIAQEITALMTQDASFSGHATNTYPIPYLINEIIDNENSFIPTSTGNSFTVSDTGTYQVMMNITMVSSTESTGLVIGVWDDTDNHWIARVNDTYIAPLTGRQTYTLTTAIDFDAAKTYSFRVAAPAGTTVTLRALSSGTTGSGPVSYVSVKRLK